MLVDRQERARRRLVELAGELVLEVRHDLVLPLENEPGSDLRDDEHIVVHELRELVEGTLCHDWPPSPGQSLTCRDFGRAVGDSRSIARGSSCVHIWGTRSCFVRGVEGTQTPEPHPEARR